MIGRRNAVARGLPPLAAPEHLIGRMSKWTDAALRAERTAWAAARGREGYSSGDVARALGIAQPVAHGVMVRGGWDTWADKRRANA